MRDALKAARDALEALVPVAVDAAPALSVMDCKAIRDARTALAQADAALAAPVDGSPFGRDADWSLAMAEALGTDSGFSVPIVPSPDAFRELFAAVRLSAPADVVEDARSVPWNVMPQIVGDESGREPSLRMMVMHYYTSHGIREKEARAYATDYIAAIDSIARKEQKA